VIRRKGAEGSLPVPPEEALEILNLLAQDADPDLREVASSTLLTWYQQHPSAVSSEPPPSPTLGPPAPLPSLRRPPRPPNAEDDSRVAVEAAPPGEESAVAILNRVIAGESIEAVIGGPVETPPEVTKEELTEPERVTLIQKINRMTVIQKIKAALTGNLETRALLIRDSNKVVSRAVTQSPKITDNEAELFAAARNVSEDVLRWIASNRRFIKLYGVAKALVNNSRAPIAVTLPLVNRLNVKDLKDLSRSHEIPDAVRYVAQKRVRQQEEASRAKLPWQK